MAQAARWGFFAGSDTIAAPELPDEVVKSEPHAPFRPPVFSAPYVGWRGQHQRLSHWEQADQSNTTPSVRVVAPSPRSDNTPTPDTTHSTSSSARVKKEAVSSRKRSTATKHGVNGKESKPRAHRRNASSSTNSDEEEKILHRAKEGARRQRLINAIELLRSSLGLANNTQKISVLQSAVSRLELLRAEDKANSMARLQRENEELKNQLMRAQTQQANGTGTRTVPITLSLSSLMISGGNPNLNYQSIFHCGGLPMCIATTDCRILDMNTAFTKMILVQEQYARSSGLTGLALTPAEHIPKLYNEISKLIVGQAGYVAVIKDQLDLHGGRFQVFARFCKVADDQGNGVKYIMASLTPTSQRVVEDVALRVTAPFRHLSVQEVDCET